MRCEEARDLFNAYLDGELSAALATELGAHRLKCAECRRRLALLEVSGHILASDRDPVSIGDGFTDRLLACMEKPAGRWTQRLRHRLYWAGPLAAAAVVALAFLGLFDRGSGRFAGDKVIVPEPVIVSPGPEDSTSEAGMNAVGESQEPLESYLRRAQETLANKRKSGESLQNALDLTIGQLLDILDEGQRAARNGARAPAKPAVKPEEQPADSADGQTPATPTPAPSGSY